MLPETVDRSIQVKLGKRIFPAEELLVYGASQISELQTRDKDLLY